MPIKQLWFWVRGEMAPSAKHSNKHEDPSWDLQNPSEKPGVAIILGLDRQRLEDLELAGQPVWPNGELQAW